MNRITLFVIVAVGLAAFRIPALSQAAAESALIGATSSLSTVNAASSLNRALNQSSGQLAGRLQKVSPISPQHLTQQHARKAILKSPVRTAAGHTDSLGLMIVSIQGGETRCEAGSAQPEGKKDRSDAETPNTKCIGADASSKPKLLQPHNSAVPLPK
jgi:hypothetical protein